MPSGTVQSLERDRRLRKQYVCPTCMADAFNKGWTRKVFGQRIGHILRSCAFQQLAVAIAHELLKMMHSTGDMPSALPISEIFFGFRV